MSIVLFKLAPYGRRDGISCDAHGAFIGSVPLLKRIREHGRDAWVPRDPRQLSKELLGCFGLPIDMAPKATGLAAIACALNADDIARAQMLTLFLRFPDPSPVTKAKPDRTEVIKFVDQLIANNFVEAKLGPTRFAKFNHNHWPAKSPDSQGGKFAPKGAGGDGSVAGDSQSPQLQLPTDASANDKTEDVRVTAGQTDSASYGTDSFNNPIGPDERSQLNQSRGQIGTPRDEQKPNLALPQSNSNSDRQEDVRVTGGQRTDGSLATDSFGNPMSPEVQHQLSQLMQHTELDSAPAAASTDGESGPSATSNTVGPHGYVPQPGDETLLARSIMAEGSGTPKDMAAIGWSIVNRIGLREYGQTLPQVIFQRLGAAAFSFTTETHGIWPDSADPEKNFAGANAQSWQHAVSTAQGILNGSIPDPTGEATKFFASRTFDGTPETALGDVSSGLRDNRYAPSQYQSPYPQRPHPEPATNFFFTENPRSMWHSNQRHR